METHGINSELTIQTNPQTQKSIKITLTNDLHICTFFRRPVVLLFKPFITFFIFLGYGKLKDYIKILEIRLYIAYTIL